MQNKHIQIESDRKLHKLIMDTVRSDIDLDSRKQNLKLGLKFLIYLSVLVLFYCGIYSVESLWALIGCYSAFGFTSLLVIFNFAHDLSHNTIFKNKKWNFMGYATLFTMVGAHAESWKHRHVHAHHHAPNVKDYDTDLQITSLIRVEPSAERRWFHKFQHWYAPLAYSSYSLYWVLVKDSVVYYEEWQNGELSLRDHISFWFQKAVYFSYLLVLPMIMISFSWKMVLLAFLIMHLTQSVFLLFTFFITHHVGTTTYFSTDKKGRIQTSWFNNQVQSSNDFYPFSKTANFIFGGFNNHIAHHLFPHINHVHYPQLSRILYRILEEKGYKLNQSTFFEGCILHLKHLRRMGQIPHVLKSCS